MKRFAQSLGYAWRGILAALSGQRHLRFHFGAALGVVALGLWVGLSAPEWALVTLAIGLVLSAELMNSAMESLVDLVEPKTHPLAGKAKDMAAGAVLVAAVIALVIGILVFSKYLPG